VFVFSFYNIRKRQSELLIAQFDKKVCALFSPKNNAKNIHPVKSGTPEFCTQNYLTGERPVLKLECYK
jgi:hypothetical protein